jgi:toxin ParE1/3/4
MAKVSISRKAVEDLPKVWDYTFEAWSENQADEYYKLLIETCQEIAKSPKIGKNYDDIQTDIFGFRVGKHIIFYQRIKPKEILVVRILHEQMDLKNRIED